jgi:hypothetical protein
MSVRTRRSEGHRPVVDPAPRWAQQGSCGGQVWLFNLRTKPDKDYHEVLVRFCLERLLYRLSISGPSVGLRWDDGHGLGRGLREDGFDDLA